MLTFLGWHIWHLFDPKQTELTPEQIGQKIDIITKGILNPAEAVQQNFLDLLNAKLEQDSGEE